MPSKTKRIGRCYGPELPSVNSEQTNGASSGPNNADGGAPTCEIRCRVRLPVVSPISKRVYRPISQSCCPWDVKFSQELAEDSPFRAREFIAGKDAVTLATDILATDILALDQAQFSAAFRKSPMKRAKLAGLRRNAAVVLENASRGQRP